MNPVAADAARLAQREEDRARTSLSTAVAAGHNDLAGLRADPDLDALSQRADFRERIAGLEAKPT
jgi:hypothetical protein